MTQRRPDWWYICPSCGMQTSTLEPCIDNSSKAGAIHWEQRSAAFSVLRKANAERLLNRLEKICPPPARLLDVGCAEGWFLHAARARGYTVSGIEPDPKMARKIDPELNIRTGFFPDVLGRREAFDIITFNDVFEHLPDVRGAMAACTKHLARDGILVFNLPNARGGIYRLARAAARFGFTGPFERMWQASYPSPHMSYFAPATLLRLAERYRLSETARFALPSIEPSGLWARIRFDKTRSLAYCITAWAAVIAAMPLLALMPSDISVQFFRKDGKRARKHR